MAPDCRRKTLTISVALENLKYPLRLRYQKALFHGQWLTNEEVLLRKLKTYLPDVSNAGNFVAKDLSTSGGYNRSGKRRLFAIRTLPRTNRKFNFDSFRALANSE
jgi:hypothetical protein